VGIYGGTDMKNLKLFFFVLFSGLIILPNASAKSRVDMTEAMKDSIVHLSISYYGYEQYQPWKNQNLTEGWSVGCAVTENEVITTAQEVANAAQIKVKRFGQNEFIPAKIKIVDYESDLALIELDPNSIRKALKPLEFGAKYKKGDEVNFYWLSSTEQIYSGRGYLDRASVDSSSTAHCRTLDFIAANISDSTGSGQLYCIGNKPLGIACWSNNQEAGIIPSEVINRFLLDTKDGFYNGIGTLGFNTTRLVDPALRKYLKLPDEIQHGIYVSDVVTIGTGSDVLKTGDVLLAIDGFELNPYGKFVHPQYDVIPFDCLITSKTAGEKITFKIWRDGRSEQIEALAKNFDVSEMLVPWYDLDNQPEYFIIGGCVLQKLTRTYLASRGGNWTGSTDSHIYNYLLNEAFKPIDERKSIIVLSFILPSDITLGYHGLGQCVVDSINGMKIRCMKDIPTALALKPEAKYDVIEFELDRPKIILDRAKMQEANQAIARNYGIDKLVNIRAD
jgi:S1-C subfamily serine protease